MKNNMYAHTLWYSGMHDIGMILEICYENCLTTKTMKKKTLNM